MMEESSTDSPTHVGRLDEERVELERTPRLDGANGSNPQHSAGRFLNHPDTACCDVGLPDLKDRARRGHEGVVIAPDGLRSMRQFGKDAGFADTGRSDRPFPHRGASRAARLEVSQRRPPMDW